MKVTSQLCSPLGMKSLLNGHQISAVTHLLLLSMASVTHAFNILPVSDATPTDVLSRAIQVVDTTESETTLLNRCKGFCATDSDCMGEFICFNADEYSDTIVPGCDVILPVSLKHVANAHYCVDPNDMYNDMFLEPLSLNTNNISITIGTTGALSINNASGITSEAFVVTNEYGEIQVDLVITEEEASHSLCTKCQGRCTKLLFHSNLQLKVVISFFCHR